MQLFSPLQTVQSSVRPHLLLQVSQILAFLARVNRFALRLDPAGVPEDVLHRATTVAAASASSAPYLSVASSSFLPSFLLSAPERGESEGSSEAPLFVMVLRGLVGERREGKGSERAS